MTAPNDLDPRMSPAAPTTVPPSASLSAEDGKLLPPIPPTLETLTPPSSLPDAAAPAGTISVPGYTILKELGRGGMGVVYQARHVQLNRIVALKMILAGGHAGKGELTRFHIEAESIARLQHPNIVQVYEVGEHEGKPFLSLEFCSGGTLDRKLAGTPLLGREAAKLVETLARAMHAAHQANVIHRDLKPANVLLLADGTPKITDFGLAKKLDEASGQTQSGAVMGTPSYMAPEQASGKVKQIGPLCDVYALGAILYECLTGRPPFKGATPLDTLRQVMSEEPVTVKQLNAQVPMDLETICLKCLQKEASKRYGSAAELADELGRFLRGEPIHARPVGRLERGWRWCQRNPVLASALAAVLLVFVTGASVSTVLYFRADERATAEEAARNELEESNDRLLTNVAQSLMRPLALQAQLDHPHPPLRDPEIAALWQLAESAEEKLRLRFVEEAIRTPTTTRQLRYRAAFALQAAVALDPVRRDAVERILVKDLSSEGIPLEQRTDLSLALAALAAC